MGEYTNRKNIIPQEAGLVSREPINQLIIGNVQLLMPVFLLGDKSIKKSTMIKLFCGILVLHLLTESVGWMVFV